VQLENLSSALPRIPILQRFLRLQPKNVQPTQNVQDLMATVAPPRMGFIWIVVRARTHIEMTNARATSVALMEALAHPHLLLKQMVVAQKRPHANCWIGL